MQESEQIRSVIKTIRSVIGAMRQRKISMEDIRNIQLAADEINRILYHSEQLRFQKKYDLSSDAEYELYIRELEQLCTSWEQSLKRRSGIMPTETSGISMSILAMSIRTQYIGRQLTILWNCLREFGLSSFRSPTAICFCRTGLILQNRTFH